MSTVCKLLLIVTLIGFSYYLFAKGGRYFRSTGSNYRNTKPLITKETWKPIVAGGAAAGILLIILCVIMAVSLMCRRYPWDFFKKGKQNENQ